MLTNLMKKKREGGFTLIELMIVVAIIGILAAIAIPAFINYVKRSKTTEASIQVKAMYQGAATYYQGEMAMRGIVAVGAVANVTRCIVNAAVTTNAPSSQKTVLNWSGAEDAAFAALGFNPADPLYYQYTLAVGGTVAAACGDMTAVGASLYTFRANGDLDDDGTLSTFEINSSVNMEGNLYNSGGVFIANELE